MITHEALHHGVFSNECFAHPLKIQLEATCKPPRPQKRRVRFDTEERVINPIQEFYTDDDVRVRWYGMEELCQIKQHAKEQSNMVRKRSKDRDCLVAVAHRKTTLLLRSDFRAIVKLSPTTPDQDLARWCSYNDGRRGLERFSSRDYCAFRRSDIMNARTAVIEEQTRQRGQNSVDQEAIAQRAREASKRARTFAQVLATADDLEAQQVHEEQVEEEQEMRDLDDSFRRVAPPRKKSKLSMEMKLPMKFAANVRIT
jgi:hypothetical protein